MLKILNILLDVVQIALSIAVIVIVLKRKE